MSFDEIVNHGSSSWHLVTANKVSPDVVSCSANAVPNVDDWQSLIGGGQEHGLIFRYTAPWIWPLDNYLHVEITVALYWQPHARYRGGGAYIPNIWTVLQKVDVGMDWNADLSINIHPPTNRGTNKLPIAAVPITIHGEIYSGLSSRRETSNFLILGTGDYETDHHP
jgi:hypothetical protein